LNSNETVVITERCQQARAKAYMLMVEHGLFGWKLRFNNSRDFLGLCCPGMQWIALSALYVEHNPWSCVRDTVLHEIAHALTGPDHGEAWERKCVELGCPSETRKFARMPDAASA
jgi:hypothetical protein